MPRIAVITAMNELYEPLAQVTLPVMKAYCDRHGYDLYVGEYHARAATQRDRLTRGDLCKSGMYLDLYAHYDIIAWFDLDLIPVNHAVRVEDVLGSRDWLWTCNTDGPMSGFWIARTTPFVRAWVSRFAFACAYECGGGDQYAMREVAKWAPYDRLVGGDNCVWGKDAGHTFAPEIGCPPGMEHTIIYAPGDWLVTAPGIPLHQRIEILKRYVPLCG